MKLSMAKTVRPISETKTFTTAQTKTPAIFLLRHYSTIESQKWFHTWQQNKHEKKLLFSLTRKSEIWVINWFHFEHPSCFLGVEWNASLGVAWTTRLEMWTLFRQWRRILIMACLVTYGDQTLSVSGQSLNMCHFGIDFAHFCAKMQHTDSMT